MQHSAESNLQQKPKNLVKTKKALALQPVAEAIAPAANANSDAVRNELITKYLSYANSIAAKLARTFPDEVDYDEVVCNARLGLLEAAKRFNPGFSVDFKTFSYYRIKGAIYDGLRKTGWIPRSLYSKIKFEKAANEFLETNVASGGSKAGFLQNELKDLQSNINSVASIYVMSIEGIEDFELEDQQAKKDIENRAEFHKIKEKVCDAIEGLPDKERKLIKMYYFQNKTMEEIGEQLELSKSWTSRLHARGLELMFKKITEKNKDMVN